MSSPILPVGALVFGALAIYAGIYTRREISQKSGWPTAPGRLTKRGIVVGASAGGGPIYVPDIAYSYSVAGKEYTATQMFSGKGEGYDAGTMKKKVDALPDAPAVHYNPDNPGEAYLVLTAAWWWWLALTVGVLFALFGGLLLLGRLSGSGGGS